MSLHAAFFIEHSKPTLIKQLLLLVSSYANTAAKVNSRGICLSK